MFLFALLVYEQWFSVQACVYCNLLWLKPDNLTCQTGWIPWLTNDNFQSFIVRFVLPSVLFSNRAQCYLTMKKWRETIQDCTQAIVRSFEGI